MKETTEEILDICLEKIKQGIPVDELLKAYPDYRDELKELLAIARDIKDTPSPQVSDRALASCLIKVGEALQLQKQTPQQVKLPRLFYFPSPAWARALVLALIIIFISWGTANLSAESLPGELLYPVKLITEKVKFFLTVNPQNKVQLRLIYAEERTQELVKHLDKRGALNIPVLKAMLDEASLALENISAVPEAERAVYYSKLEHLNAYQKDVLEGLAPKVPPAQKAELNNAIQMCGRRMQWMGKMMRQQMPPGKWGSGCGGK